MRWSRTKENDVGDRSTSSLAELKSNRAMGFWDHVEAPEDGRLEVGRNFVDSHIRGPILEPENAPLGDNRCLCVGEEFLVSPFSPNQPVALLTESGKGGSMFQGIPFVPLNPQLPSFERPLFAKADVVEVEVERKVAGKIQKRTNRRDVAPMDDNDALLEPVLEERAL